MKKTILSRGFQSRLLVICALVFALALAAASSVYASGAPLITVDSVVPGVSVTISGTNFPADKAFNVLMGPYGTLGIGGEVVGVKEASNATTFTATYTIPATLAGAAKIAIRLENSSGYYSYNWFENIKEVAATATVSSTGTDQTSATPEATEAPVKYTGIPSFTITAVQQAASVSILTANFPAGQTFTVRMGEFGTAGKNGVVVGTTDSAKGGAITADFPIPAELANLYRIAIRFESASGYYSYNWFYNIPFNATAVEETPASSESPEVVPTAEAPAATAEPLPTPVITSVIPSVTVDAVVKDQSVTLTGVNFPAGQTFTLRMGAYGTMGVNGRIVTTVAADESGTFTATYPIPSEVAGGSKIAVRFESDYYYTYCWFYNN